MKITAHLPTVEYGYIEIECDSMTEFTNMIVSAEVEVQKLKSKNVPFQSVPRTPPQAPTSPVRARVGSEPINIGERCRKCPEGVYEAGRDGKPPWCRKCYVAWKNNQPK